MSIQKSKYGFEENEQLINRIQAALAQRSNNPSISIIQELEIQDSVLFETYKKPKTVGAFVEFIGSGGQKDASAILQNFELKYENFVAQSLNEAEEADLLANNDEYKMLIKEYRDGILLFSLMNEMVWQKALEDSAGQVKYFQENLSKYQWNERVQSIIVTMTKEEQTASVRKFLSDKKYQTNLQDRLENTFLLTNPLAFTIQNGVFEWENNSVLKQADRDRIFQEIKEDNKTHFIVAGKKFEPGPKRFEETRGKVIQDYQEYLDNSIINTLKENFVIQINEDEKQKIYENVVLK
jgi:peptidyl-prolyl cis-trans isomerase SurA